MKKIQELIKKICKLIPTLDRKSLQSEIMNIIKRIEVHPDEELFDELDAVLARTLIFSPNKTKTK